MLLSLVFTLVYLSTFLVVPLIGTRETLLSVWTLGDCFIKSPSLLDAVAYGRTIGSVLRAGVLDVGLGNATALLAGGPLDISGPLRHGLVVFNANIVRVGLFAVAFVVLGALLVFVFFAAANTLNEHFTVHNVLNERQPSLAAEEQQTSLSLAELYDALTTLRSEVECWRDANGKLDDDVVSLEATVVQVKANHDIASAALAAATTQRHDEYQRWKAAQEQHSNGEKKREEEQSRARSVNDALRCELDAIPNQLQELQEREARREETRTEETEQVVVHIDKTKTVLVQKHAELVEGDLRARDLRSNIAAEQARVADTLKEVSEAEEAVVAAEKEAADEEEEYKTVLAAKMALLETLKGGLNAARLHEESETARKTKLLADLGAVEQDAETADDDFNTTHAAAQSKLSTIQGTLDQRADTVNAIGVKIGSLKSSYTDIGNRVQDTESQLASTVAATSKAAAEFKNIAKGRLALVESLEAEVRSLRRTHNGSLKMTTALRTELADVEKRCATSIAQAKHRGEVAEKLHQRKLVKIDEERRRLDRYLHQLSGSFEASQRRRAQLEQELTDIVTQIELSTPLWKQTHQEKTEKEAERWAARDALEREWTQTCATRDEAKAIADRDDAEATHAEESAKQDKAALEDMRATFCTTLASLRSDNEKLDAADRTLSAEVETQKAEVATMDDAIQELPMLHIGRMEAMSDRLDALEAQIRRARAARRPSSALLAAEADHENAQDTLQLMTMTADGLESHLEAAHGRHRPEDDAAGLLADLENG